MEYLKIYLKRTITHFVFLLVIFTYFLTANPAYGLDFQIFGAIRETYDDNIFSYSDNEIYDYITDLSLGLGLIYEDRKQNINLNGLINQQFYVKNHDLNNNSQEVNFNYVNQLTSKSTLQFIDRFQHIPEPSDFETTFGRSVERSGYYTNTVTANFTQQFTSHYRMSVRYNNRYTKNDDDNLIDSYSNGGGISLGYLLNWSNLFFLTYDYTRIDYETGLITIENRGGLQYQHYFSRQFFFTGSAGRQHINPSEGSSSSSTIYTAAITDDVDELNTLEIMFTKEYTVVPQTEELFDNWRISGLFRRQVTRRSIFSLTIFYGEGEYHELHIINKLVGVLCSYTYRYSENIVGILNYSYSYGITEMPGFEDEKFDRNIITLSLEMRY